MKRFACRGMGILVTIAVASLTTLPAVAQVTTYSSRTVFEAAHPGLPVETFEEARFPAGSDWVSFATPLDAATSNAVFSPGEVNVPLRFASTGSSLMARRPPDGLSGFPLPSVALIPNDDAAALEITFPPDGVLAVGFDVFAEDTTPPNGGTLRIDLFDTSDLPLGQYDLSGFLLPGGGFFGADSPTPIGRVRVNAPWNGLNGSYEAVDNVSSVTAAPVPVFGPASFALLLLVLAPLGLFALRRRRA